MPALHDALFGLGMIAMIAAIIVYMTIPRGFRMEIAHQRPPGEAKRANIVGWLTLIGIVLMLIGAIINTAKSYLS